MYDGNFDISCNHPGILKMFDKMTNWTDIDSWRNTPSVPVPASDGRIVGYLKQYKNFSMFVMRNAGHVVPRSQPKYSFELFHAFLSGGLNRRWTI